jgi:hypothetical protein
LNILTTRHLLILTISPVPFSFQVSSAPHPSVGRRSPSRIEVARSDAADTSQLWIQNVGRIERLVDLGEPFSPVGGTAAAALIERKFQLG